jgi:hypothetical protein
MNLRNTAIFIVLAGGLAAGTLFIASIFFTGFNGWVESLTDANQRLLPSIFLALTALFVCIGAFLRRRMNSSDGDI